MQPPEAPCLAMCYRRRVEGLFFVVVMGRGKGKRTRLVLRNFCKVRLAGTLVSMELIYPYSENERRMDLAKLPEPVSSRTKNPTCPCDSKSGSFWAG